MGLISGLQDILPNRKDRLGAVVVNHLGSQQPNARVSMFRVVPVEEVHQESAGILDGAKALREIGPILEGLKVSLRERVVVGNLGATVALGYPQVGQQESHRLGDH